MPKAILDRLPDKARDIYEAVWKKTKDEGHDDEKAAMLAIGAVKRAGYHKDEESGQWVKMHTLDWHITKATLGADGIMRWHGTVSKFAVDVQGDEVTPKFIQHAWRQVKKGLRPAPVVCVSHIDKGQPDDSWVAGDVEEVYVDGQVPKAKGTFLDNSLGRASFEAVRTDIREKKPRDERVRFCMGFFDEGSQIIKSRRSDGKEIQGRRFFMGWIKHLALTRVPVVPETDITASLEVHKMTKPKTKRDDAATIVGEDLANELAGAAEKADLEEADLILKQEEDEEEETTPEEEEETTSREGEDEGEGNQEENEEEEEPGEKASFEIDADAPRRDQVKALLGALEVLLLGEDLEDEGRTANRVAPGSPGTNPPPSPRPGTGPGTTVERSQVDPYLVSEPTQHTHYQAADPELAGFGEPMAPHDTAVVSFVDDWAMRVKSVLLSEADRTDKFSALQHALNDFGEGVQILVKDQTPPSGRDMADVITDAVRQAVEPVYNELAGVKAQLAQVMQDRAGTQGKSYVPQPRAMDGRAVVMPDQSQQQLTMPQGIGQGTALRTKARSASELAWASTAEGNPLGHR